MAKRSQRVGPSRPAKRATKEQRKEQARREREEIRRRAVQRRRYRIIGAITGPVVVVAVIVGVFFATRGSGLPGLQTGLAPWPPELTQLRERLQELGLPAQASMAETLHFHDHLDVYVDGHSVEVPQNIGINASEGYLTSIHTHDASGIIHIESPTQRTFTLGEFFDVWGVRFTASCLARYCNAGDRTVRVFVDGKPITGDPRMVQLTPHDEIVVAYGTSAQLPSPMTSTYQFPAGL